MQKRETVKRLFQFIDKSPSCFHTIANAIEQLEEAGYQELEEVNEWEICCGGKYYVNRNGSSLIAFHLPERKPDGFHFVASHSDSPCFKIKELPEILVENQYVKLNVEKYGGMIVSTWLDRPLSVAGRVAVKTGGETAGERNPADCYKPVMKNVAVDRDLLLIPNIAIHMNRDMNKGTEYSIQTDMLPLYGGADSKDSFKKLIADTAGVAAEDILSSDLFLYHREKCRIFGAADEFICAPRLDDLGCVYASLEAFLHAVPDKYVNVMVIFDNEEVGSATRQGAASTFLYDTLTRVCEALEISESGYIRMLADSFMISADNAHAVHPNHPEKADATNRPYLNGGIAIKYHGSQKYTTDAFSAAVMKEICRRAEVPFQTYANHSDIAGGSTLGNISAVQVPVSTVDIGLPQLAMHSAYETAGAEDIEYMIRALSCFYSA